MGGQTCKNWVTREPPGSRRLQMVQAPLETSLPHEFRVMIMTSRHQRRGGHHGGKTECSISRCGNPSDANAWGPALEIALQARSLVKTELSATQQACPKRIAALSPARRGSTPSRHTSLPQGRRLRLQAGPLRVSGAIGESCEVSEQARKTKLGNRGSRQGRNWNTNQASDGAMT